jgi:hypothetical protein
MFAMKRVIISAACILLISGCAAAQSTSAKQPVKKEATLKKATAPKIDVNDKTVLKQEASANAKSDSSVKLLLTIPNFPVDSTAVPIVKKNDE